MWLILDAASADTDMALAHHVIHVHREGRAPVGILEERDSLWNDSKNICRGYHSIR